MEYENNEEKYIVDDDFIEDDDNVESEEYAEGYDDDYEPWAKDPEGIEIARKLLEASKNIIGTLNPVVDNADFKNELANIFVCMKYIEIQKQGLREMCPNIYDIETEIRAITKQDFMDTLAYDIDISIAAMNLNTGDEFEEEENLKRIFNAIGKARVQQLKAAKMANR